jgi:hypothetical protein
VAVAEKVPLVPLLRVLFRELAVLVDQVVYKVLLLLSLAVEAVAAQVKTVDKAVLVVLAVEALVDLIMVTDNQELQTQVAVTHQVLVVLVL